MDGEDMKCIYSSCGRGAACSETPREAAALAAGSHCLTCAGEAGVLWDRLLEGKSKEARAHCTSKPPRGNQVKRPGQVKFRASGLL